MNQEDFTTEDTESTEGGKQACWEVRKRRQGARRRQTEPPLQPPFSSPPGLRGFTPFFVTSVLSVVHPLSEVRCTEA